MPANNTIWILGDSLLNEAAGHYNFFKRKKGEPKTADTPLLYMENMYAIRMVPSGLYTAKQAENIPNIILNSLVDTLNVKAKVPHTLVIVINDSRFWNNGDLLTYQMERILRRFFKEIRRIIEARNLSLPPKAVNWDYPRLFITKALPLPNNMTKQYPKGFKPHRRRYNKLIQRGESEDNYRAINFNDFTSENDNKLFTPDGAVTTKGFHSFWATISDAIHKADNQDRIELNKARAKQLAPLMTYSTDQSASTAVSEDNPTKQVKRALLQEFNSSEEYKRPKNRCESPGSDISEYFTHTHPNTVYDNQSAHRKPDNRVPGFFHHKPTYYKQNNHFVGKRKGKNKNNWRNKQY